jgi:hypothetical protein
LLTFNKKGSASRLAGARAIPGSVPARVSMAEIPAAVCARDGLPPLMVSGSVSATRFAYRTACPVSSTAHRVPSQHSHFDQATT